MKPITALVFLLLFAITAHAEIYKSTDAEGKIIYSDKESSNTTEIQGPGITTTPTPVSDQKKTTTKESATEETGDEIYKGTDAEGNVIYSDEELPNGAEIQVPDLTTVTMPKPKKTVKEDVVAKNPYTTFKILSPGNDDTIRVTSGDVPVTLFAVPALDIGQGHSISVYIDGVATIKKTTLLDHKIPNVSRGSHTLSAEIRDAKDKVITKSNAVEFHMKRKSEQHNKPTGAPPGPIKSDGTPYKPGPQGVTFKPGPNVQPSP